jgi:seryl-tRNA synthetase
MPSTASSSEIDSLLERLGVRWHSRGHVTFSGRSLVLLRGLDRLFLEWARAWNAAEYAFPPFLAARDLGRTDYFKSFQHLATFPVSLSEEEDALVEFATKNARVERALELGSTRAVEDVLTPAACYHVYAHFQESALREPTYVTTQATCFRREAHYSALERQWSFTMREIVCLATAPVVRDFLSVMRERLGEFFRVTALPVSFEPATDPFFQGARHPKHFAQELETVKWEMVFAGRLAMGSLNYHRNYFGESFAIRSAGAPAFSACVAFGIERWIHAIVATHGANPANWPAELARCGEVA